MSPRPTLLIATTNRGKFREVHAILSELPLRLIGLDDFPKITVAVEDGAAFEENARRKALHYARLTGHWALADDSGLEVDALDGAPGIHSARFAGCDADDAANNAKLLAALANVSPHKRTARFRCVVALADATKVLTTASGTVEGLIIEHPRGRNGFGYDPHFFLPELGMTAAELSPEVKNRISHRAKALVAIRPRVETLLSAIA